MEGTLSPLPALRAILAPRGEQRLRRGHPWVYRSDLLELPQRAGIGTVLAPDGEVLTTALLNPDSQIAVRDLGRDWSERALEERLERALALRSALHIDGDAYRLVHGEGDRLPGLVIDRYGEVLVIQNGAAGFEPQLEGVIRWLAQRLAPRGVLARHDQASREREGLPRECRVLLGEVPQQLQVWEAGLQLLVDPYRGQKTGACLDQRETRQRLGQLAHGDALDVFCYQGAFAVHLARSPAVRSLRCVDTSLPALRQAAANLARNGVGPQRARLVRANAFRELPELAAKGQRFQTINLDPPALARKRADLPAAYRAYRELNRRALALLDVGGLLCSSSCSFHLAPTLLEQLVAEAAADLGQSLRVLERRAQSADHPELLGVPETRYLKTILVERIR